MTLPPIGRPTVRTWLRGSILAVLVLGLAVAGWAIHFAGEFTHATHRPVGRVPADFPFAVESVQFPATDGLPIAGWFVPCPGATRVAVLLHGARRNRLENVDRARLLREQGYAVLLYDARGCGESGGDRLTFGYLEARDLIGALDYLRGRGFHHFGLLGFSQGGATILNAAGSLRELCWVVLECTPPDVRLTFAHDMRIAYGRWGGVCERLLIPLFEWQLGIAAKDLPVPLDSVGKLHCPIYVIAGGADVRTPPDEVRLIFERANEPKWFWLIPGVPHMNYYPKLGAIYERNLRYFLKLAERAGESSAHAPRVLPPVSPRPTGTTTASFGAAEQNLNPTPLPLLPFNWLGRL